MMTASQIRPGMAIRFDNQTYKIVAAEYQPGQGKMGGVMHARLKNLTTGTFWEHGFRAELKVEEVPIEKRVADFLYMDGDDCTFMDPLTFEQHTVPAASLGRQAQLLAPEMRVQMEFVHGAPVSVQFPDTLEIRVKDTTPPAHTQDSTWKSALLEGGLEIMVPQFIKIGDMIRIDGAELRYMDRARSAGRA
jgi:elongation factor P